MKTIIIALMLAMPIGALADEVSADLTPGFDWCTNIDDVQLTIPVGYHAESDGTCTVLQTPVTIDVNQGAEPVTIDIVAPGEEAKTIDVLPRGGTHQSVQAAAAATPTVIKDVMILIPKETPAEDVPAKVYESVSTDKGSGEKTIVKDPVELKTFTFDTKTTEPERVQTIRERIVNTIGAIIKSILSIFE